MAMSLLVTDDFRIYRQYLNQFTDDYRFVGPKEFSSAIEVLMIPSINVFSGFESEIERNGNMNVSISIDTGGRTFYEGVLQKYIDNGTKIIAIGSGADMLWVKLGGKLRTTQLEPGFEQVIGNYETSPLRGLNPRLGSDFSFHLTDYFEASNFELIERAKSVIPLAWKTGLNRHDYQSKIKTATDLIPFQGNQVVAFEHISEKIYGIKSMPTGISHKLDSEVHKKFGYFTGSPLVNSIIKFLLDGGSTETVSVSVNAK